MKKSIVLCIALCMIKLSPAQQVTLTNTLLWKLGGNGLPKDSYILFTGNTCNNNIQLNDKVQKAMKAVNTIAVERNLYDKDARKLQENNIARADSQKITNNLSEAEYQVFVKKLKDAGAPDAVINRFNSFKIGMVYYALLMAENPCEMQGGMEVHEVMLQRYAAKNGLSYQVLQDVDRYIGQFNHYPNGYWVANIRNLLTSKDDIRQVRKNEVEFYNAENVLGLQALYNSHPFFKLQFAGPDQVNHVQFLTSQIEAQAKQAPLLIAIHVSNAVMKGASVLETLQQKGYTVTPVNE
jgi:uncharacterized protein YbaP (TraB family)